MTMTMTMVMTMKITMTMVNEITEINQAAMITLIIAIIVIRNQRMIMTMTKIGPAVLNGGVSTLLAFSLLYTSQSYVFLSFFKIFFLICILGLFHGLLVLPVLLSLIGPLPNSKQVQTQSLKIFLLFPPERFLWEYLNIVVGSECLQRATIMWYFF